MLENSLTYGNKDGKIYHIEKQLGGFDMENLKNRAEKICSFYVSEWHLVTMLLPYINKELNEKANIITVLEKDIEYIHFQNIDFQNLELTQLSK